MSRIRTGHTPDAWLQEEPQEHVRRYTPTAFGAAPVGAMKPILTMGGNCLEGREAWKLPALAVVPDDWRRTQEAEASARYRARRR